MLGLPFIVWELLFGACIVALVSLPLLSKLRDHDRQLKELRNFTVDLMKLQSETSNDIARLGAGQRAVIEEFTHKGPLGG